MNIANLTKEEKWKLRNQLEEDLGVYSLLVLCIDDLKDSYENEDQPIPSDEVLKQACKYVWRKWENSCDEFSCAVDWALEVTDEITGKVENVTN